MTAKSASVFNLEPGNALAAAGIGAGIGVGGRALKNLWDMWQDRDISSAVAHKLPKPTANRVQIPVTVSPEEAKELEAQGMHVKAAADLGFFDKFLLGAGGAGAAALGWHGVDGYFDNQRMSLAKQKLQNARNRVQKLLAGNASGEDAHLGQAMKVAEDAMIKEGSWMPDMGSMLASGANGLINTVSDLGYPAGVGAALVAASAFNEARKRNKALNNSKAISDYANAQKVRSPVAELSPVLAKTAAALRERVEELKGRLHGRPA